MSFFKKILGKDDRKGAEKQVFKGALAARENLLEKALQHYQKAVAKDKTYALAHLNLALTYQDIFNRDREILSLDEKHEQLLNIIEHLENALVQDDENVLAWRSLGVAAMSLKAPIRAEEAFTRVLQLCAPDFEHAREVQKNLARMKIAAEKERCIQKVLSWAEALDAPEQMQKKTLSADENSAIREALAEVQEILDATADEVRRNDLFFAAAVLYKNLEEPKNARLYFERVLKTLPHHARALREAATLCLALDDFDEALQHSLAAYRDDPTDAGVTCNVGVCYLAQNQLEKAGEFIALANELDPKDEIVKKAFSAWQQASES